MSFWSRFLPWNKSEPAQFVSVYPVLPGLERVVVTAAQPPAPIREWPKARPAQKTYAGTKPWNKIKTAQKIATGVLAEMRSGSFDGVYTIAEMDQWIMYWCRSNNVEMGRLTFGTIRSVIKKQSGVRFENRRLKTDPLFHWLRSRHRDLKRPVPERAWIFIISSEPEHVEASVQPERRAA